MSELKREALRHCQAQRDYMQKWLDALSRGWTIRDPDSKDKTDKFKKDLAEKVEELDSLIADLEGR
jgi:hypothetical protein